MPGCARISGKYIKMLKDTVKKLNSFLFVFVILVLISGCETIEAIRTGDIKMRDIGHMIELGIANTREIGDIEKENTIWEKIKKADTWFQQNLW